MGKFFELPSDSMEFAKGMFDDMLNDWSGKRCRLVYKITEQVCPNCIINPRTQESTNRYKTGGPIPFPNGQICPVCDGRGRIASTGLSDIIKMSIDWSPKAWLNTSIGANAPDKVRLPGGLVTTRGFLSDLPKILQADYVLLDIDSQYLTNQFKLYGEPIVPGATVKYAYFMAIWQRAG